MHTAIIEQGIEVDVNFQDHIIGLLADSEVIQCNALIAFVTLNGLMQVGAAEDGALREFLLRDDTEFHWIVGGDQITTHLALATLNDLIHHDLARHSVKVFLSNGNRLFHPKVYIFKKRNGSGTVLVGSNNLTPGGLSGNYEVSVRLDNLSTDQMDLWMELWTKVDSMTDNLNLINEDLISHIKDARKRDRPRGRRRRVSVLGQVPPSFGEVLIREIPRAGTRTTQVHFTRRIMEEYFHFVFGQAQEAQFQLFENGHLAQIERRPLVYSESNRNPKIELSGARRIADNYPADGQRPMIVFERISKRMYRYMSLLPDDDGFRALSTYLATIPQPKNALRFAIVEQEKILDLWPDYPM